MAECREQGLPHLYRMARTMPTSAFQDELLARTQALLRCRYAALNEWHAGDFVGAGTAGRTTREQEAMSRRWLAMGRPDLDILTAAATRSPGSACFVNSDDSRLHVAEMSVVREFMQEFDICHAMGIALDASEWGCTVLLYGTRGVGEPPFSDADAAALTEFAAHVGECVSINFVLNTIEHSPGELRPVAIVGDDGSVLHLTAAFAGVLCNHLPKASASRTSFPSAWLDAAKREGRMTLPRRAGTLKFTKRSGCWLVQLECAFNGDGLTLREREVSTLYASGWSNKDIALELGVSHHTVRVHVQHVFEKMKVSSRKGLRSRLHAVIP